MPGITTALTGITGSTLGRRGVVLDPATAGVTHALAACVTQCITVLSTAVTTGT